MPNVVAYTDIDPKSLMACSTLFLKSFITEVVATGVFFAFCVTAGFSLLAGADGGVSDQEDGSSEQHWR